MKLDYIADINEFGEDVVRLYDFNRLESIQFRDVLRNFLDSGKTKLDLGTVDFIEARNCSLLLAIWKEDEGVLSEDKENFFCLLTRESYENIIQFIEPFCKKDIKAYKLLYELDNPTDFLYSPVGTWEEPESED